MLMQAQSWRHDQLSCAGTAEDTNTYRNQA